MSSSEDEGHRMESPVFRTKRQVNDYQNLSDKKQAYLRQGMYIGNDKKQKFTTYILPIPEDEEKSLNMEEKTINIPEGVVRVFLEIISNAADNAVESRQQGIDPHRFEINVDRENISVKNFGIPIPIVKRGAKTRKGVTVLVPYEEGMKRTMYPPEFIFGFFRTSSNYDDNITRQGIGQNGYGAKLTNLFSKHFEVIVEDPEERKKFKGVWKDNFYMEDPDARPDVEVTDLSDKIKRGSVKVSWKLDFERFKIKNYTDDYISYLARICVDFSFSCKVPIIFNGRKLDYRSIRDYATLYFPSDKLENCVVQYIWGISKSKKKENSTTRNELGTKKLEKIINSPKSTEDLPSLEVMFLDTPDEGKIISYVNGLVTRNGGKHVDAVLNPLAKHLMKIVNGDRKKGTITPQNIKPHVSIIVNARVPNPQFDSQTKTKLDSPDIHVDILPALLRQTNNWDIVGRLFAELEAKGHKGATTTDGKKQKDIKMKGRDANFAGDKESMNCVLYLTEGDSATGYPQWRISNLKGAYDYNGYMPLRGKILNVTKAKQLQYNESKLIASIKNAMGFCEGIDYSLEHNLSKLRYGYLVIAADADVDGMHIVALVLNLMREKFPGMLTSNRVSYLRTPIIKTFKGDKVVNRFFHEKEFYEWKDANPKDFKKLRIEYYKGLGSFSEEDAQDDIEIAPTVICFHDSEADRNFDLAFHEDRSNDRKDWIEKWRDVAQSDDILSIDLSQIKTQDGNFEGQNISQFINRELVGYSVSSLFRAIPSEYDHLKESQRKGLYGVMKEFNYKYSSRNKTVKVETIANKVTADVEYHHGAKNLADTLIKMAQDFTGSNNMGYFTKKGMFGSRDDGGLYAAAARYSKIQLSWWIPYVYYKESIDLIPKRDVDGNEAEPLWLPSVIPVGVVNGMNGIGTGFSTFMPCYNPLDIVEIIEGLCNAKSGDMSALDDFDLIPWFNGFKGKSSIETRAPGSSRGSRTPRKEVIPTVETPSGPPEEGTQADDFEKGEADVEKANEIALKESKKVLKTVGIFKTTGRTKRGELILKITELPPKTWTHKFDENLASMILEKGKKKLISYRRNKSKPNTVDIEIHWKSKDVEPTVHNLHLVRTFGLSNITLIDHQGFPKKYKSVKKVLKTYFKHMIEHYGQLRDHRIKIEEEKIKWASFKTRYIQARLDGEIEIVKVDEEKIKSELERIGVPFKIYDEAKERDLSVQSLERWKKEIAQAQARLEEAKGMTPEGIWLEKLAKLKKELKKRWKNGEYDMRP